MKWRFRNAVLQVLKCANQKVILLNITTTYIQIPTTGLLKLQQTLCIQMQRNTHSYTHMHNIHFFGHLDFSMHLETSVSVAYCSTMHINESEGERNVPSSDASSGDLTRAQPRSGDVSSELTKNLKNYSTALARKCRLQRCNGAAGQRLLSFKAF